MTLKKIFIINLCLGVFASLAHFPVIALKLSGTEGFEAVSLAQVLPLVPLDLILLIGAIAALAGSEQRKEKILPIHAVALILLALVIVGMLLWFLLLGFSEGNFSWSPGFGAALVGYSVHVGKRAFYRGKDKRMDNAGWYAAAIVFALELMLGYKFYTVHFA